MATFIGTTNDDFIVGTDNFDDINVWQGGPAGGNDTVFAGEGDDIIFALEAMNTLDRFDGGDGLDYVQITGTGYDTTPLVFDAATMINVETFQFGSNGNFNLVLHDGTVGEGRLLTFINTNNVGDLSIDGSAETDGSYFFYAIKGRNILTGGAQADTFDFSYVGSPFLFDPTNQVDGGDGFDTLRIRGDYTGANALVFDADALLNVEYIILTSRFGPIDTATLRYDLTTDEATVEAGESLVVDGSYLGDLESFVFNGAAETDGTFTFYAGQGANTLNAGAGDDRIEFLHGAMSFDDDRVDGRGGFDTLVLDGTYYDGTGTVSGYSNALFGTRNVELVILRPGANGAANYKLEMSNGTVAAGQTMTIDGAALDSSDRLIFLGTKELDGSFGVLGGAGGDDMVGGAVDDTLSGAGAADYLRGGAGDDSVEGGEGNDRLLGETGNDTVVAGAGRDYVAGNAGADTLILEGWLTAADSLDGGLAADIVILEGDYASAPLTFAATTMVRVETLQLVAGFSYDLTSHDATVAASALLTVAGGGLGGGDVLRFDGSAETDGRFSMLGGAASDVLIGGAGKDVLKGADGDNSLTGGNGNDSLTAGVGTDTLVGGSGADTLSGGKGGDSLQGGAGVDRHVYTAVNQSTGVTFDTLDGFDFSADLIDLNVGVTAIDPMVATGALDASSFNGDLAAALNAAALDAGHAVIFTPDSGSFAGRTLLVVEANAIDGYQANKDYVFELVNPLNLGAMTASDFV